MRYVERNMSNLSIGNFQFNKQNINLPYQAVIIILHWLDCVWEEQQWAKITIMSLNSFFLPYNIRFLCPQAPTIFVDCDNKEEPAWYNIISPEDLENGENDRGLFDSIRWIEELIKEETDKGILSQNIFIAGISQGGSLALAIAMTSQYELGGFVSLAGFVPYPKILKANESNKTTPIFMGHGREDKKVPYEVAQKSFQILKQNGYQVETLKDYPELGHEPLHFFPMVIDGSVFLKKIFQTRNLPKLNFFNPENFIIVRKLKIKWWLSILK